MHVSDVAREYMHRDPATSPRRRCLVYIDIDNTQQTTPMDRYTNHAPAQPNTLMSTYVRKAPFFKYRYVRGCIM